MTLAPEVAEGAQATISLGRHLRPRSRCWCQLWQTLAAVEYLLWSAASPMWDEGRTFSNRGDHAGAHQVEC